MAYFNLTPQMPQIPQQRAGGGFLGGLVGGFETGQKEAKADDAFKAAANGLTPEQAAQVAPLLSNEETRPYGMKMIAEMRKPKEYGFTTAPDGTLLRTDQQAGTAEAIGKYAAPRAGPAPDRPPAGFRFVDGGLAPIPGGPADPKYLDARSGPQPAPSGYHWVDPSNPSAGLAPIPGGPAGAATPDSVNPYYDGKFTVEQGKVAGYADRLTEAERVIQEKEAVGTDRWEQGKARVPIIGNEIVSNDYQQLDQAKRNFVNSVLRRESGAVISDEEFGNADKQYFPQPGDSKETLAQKERNRAAVYESYARESGPNYRPKTGGGRAQPEQAATPPKAGTIKDGYIFKGGDPSDASAWAKMP
jgi:hypothetical protein